MRQEPRLMSALCLSRRATAECVGTALLLATVVGSGVVAERPSQGDVAVARLGNTIATGAGLVALIFGKGCGSSIWTERLVREGVAEASADVEIEKVTQVSEMVPCGVMSTPAIVIDEQVVDAGGIPTKEEVRRWVLALQA
jgi:small redox-active disulfide protein 2